MLHLAEVSSEGCVFSWYPSSKQSQGCFVEMAGTAVQSRPEQRQRSALVRREVGPSNQPILAPGRSAPPSPEGLRGKLCWGLWFGSGGPRGLQVLPSTVATFPGVCRVWVYGIHSAGFAHLYSIYKYKFTVALSDPLSFHLLDRDCPSWGRKHPLPALLWRLISPLLKPFHQLLGRSFSFWCTPCFGLGPCFGLRGQLTLKCSPENASARRVPPVPQPQPAPDPSKLFSCNVRPFPCSSTCKDPCNPPACSELGGINAGAGRTTGISHHRDLSQVFYLMPFSKDVCT